MSTDFSECVEQPRPNESKPLSAAAVVVSPTPLPTMTSDSVASTTTTMTSNGPSMSHDVSPPPTIHFEYLPLSSTQEAALRRLDAAVESVQLHKQPQAIFLTGESGGGKTFVLDVFQKTVLEHTPCFMASGKFEEECIEPFFTLGGCLTTICMQLLPEKETWKRRLSKHLDDSELELLQTALIPHLREVRDATKQECCYESTTSVSSGSDTEESSSEKHTAREFAFEKLRLGIREFCKTIAQHRLLVLVFDDMQWCRDSSWPIIQTLLQDSTHGHQQLLLIGSYRTPLPEYLPQTRCLTQQTTIQLERWSRKDLIIALKSILHQDNVDRLADIALNKTGGNAFSFLQYLRMLLQQKHIVYRNGSWQWDDVAVSKLELVRQKSLRHLTHVQAALAAAACLGLSEFHLMTLYNALAAVEPVSSLSALQDILTQAVQDGSIVRMEDSHYKFAHDRIRVEAYESLPAGHTWHLKIGRQLRLWVHECTEDGRGVKNALLLQCVSQLNLARDRITDRWEAFDLAELNSQAAQVAAGKLCYGPACDFLSTSISLLGDEDPWKQHADLMREWSNELVRMEYCCGRYESCLKRCDVIIAHADKFEAKQSAYYIKVLSLFQEKKFTEARELISTILEELHCPVPRKFFDFQVYRQFKRTKKALQSKSDDELLNMSPSSNKSMTFIAEFMTLLRELSEIEGKPRDSQLHLVLLHLMQLTMDTGYFSLSQICFVSWAYLLAQQGIYEESIRFGHMGLQYAERGLGGHHDARAVILYHYYCHHWQHPYRQSLQPMKASIERLWKDGALTMVLSDSIAYLRMRFMSGCSLRHLSHEVKKYMDLWTNNKHNHQMEVNLPFFQAVSNFLGESENALSLTGEFMNQKAKFEEWTENKNEPALYMSYYHLMELAYFYGDLKLALQYGNKLCPTFSDGPYIWVTNTQFLLGMTYLSFFKATGKRMYKRKAEPCMKQMKAWVDDGVVNCSHLLLIMKAVSMAASKQQPSDVRVAFDNAIAAAGKYSFVQHQALACELAAAYGYNCNRTWYATYLEQARVFYGHWGAMGKVQELDQQYSRHMDGSTIDMMADVMSGLSFRNSVREPPSTHRETVDNLLSKWPPMVGSKLVTVEDSSDSSGDEE
jgi:predicted ATPase